MNSGVPCATCPATHSSSSRRRGAPARRPRTSPAAPPGRHTEPRRTRTPRSARCCAFATSRTLTPIRSAGTSLSRCSTVAPLRTPVTMIMCCRGAAALLDQETQDLAAERNVRRRSAAKSERGQDGAAPDAAAIDRLRVGWRSPSWQKGSGSQTQSRWLIHTDRWAGSSACLYDTGQVIADRIQVHRVHHRAANAVTSCPLITGPVGPPVHRWLRPPPQRIEQSCRPQCGRRHGDRGRGTPSTSVASRTRPAYSPARKPDDQRVGQGPADDPVDLVQPVLQDPDPDADRQSPRPSPEGPR